MLPRGMDPYREHSPCPALRPFVACLWTRSGPASAPRRVLPDGSLDLLFESHESRAEVIGAMTRAVVLRPAAVRTWVAVRFRPGGAWPFLGPVIRDLTDSTAPLGEVWTDAQALAEAIWAAPTPEVAVARLQAGLCQRLSSLHDRDLRVEAAVSALMAEPSTPIAALAARLGTSRQHLTRRVTAQAGLGPKQLARVARLRRVLGIVGEGHGVDWAEIAYRAGFCDQAHLIGDFRELVGLTPAAWARTP